MAVLFSPPPSVERSAIHTPYPSSVDNSTANWCEIQDTGICAVHVVHDFRTYRDRNYTSSFLRPNASLLSLRPGDRAAVIALDGDPRVEEILKVLYEPDTSRAASRLKEASNSKFRKISFFDWVRAADKPKEYVDSVKCFVDWHNELCELVSIRLKSMPGEIDKYTRIEKVRVATDVICSMH